MTQASLPVSVVARRGELLYGRMLRAEEANLLPAGTLANMTGRHDAAAGAFGRPGFGVLGTVFDLDGLADLFGQSVADVEASTYRTELRRLFGHGVSALKLGAVRDFRVCPACVAPRERFISRSVLLPLIHGCTKHHIWLRTTCQCGARIGAFAKQKPFTCSGCGVDWSELPQRPLGWRDDLRQRRVVHAYSVILDQTEPGVIDSARRLLSLDPNRRWDHGWCLADDPAISAQAVAPKSVNSLAGVVANLVMREVPPERLLEPLALARHPELMCQNRACRTHGKPYAMCISAYRSNGVESYCSECGSRYLGDRMILTFDRGHGSPDISAALVARARARLAEYGQRLYEAALFLSGEEEPVSVEHVFHLAGVPQASHLRARQLRLVELVHSVLERDKWSMSKVAQRWNEKTAFRWRYPASRPPVAGSVMPGLRRVGQAAGDRHDP